METIGDKLKAARLRKGMKQADVAAILDCAPTSFTNWESGRINPSIDVLARLCEVLEVSPLDLLSKEYTYEDIAAISSKPAYERTYEEQVALNFSHRILAKLLYAESIRLDAERNMQIAAFLQATKLLQRFGIMNNAEIQVVQDEYQKNGEPDEDIIFAFHTLNPQGKGAFIDMLRGLLSSVDNVQSLNSDDAKMKDAIKFTQDELTRHSRAVRHPINSFDTQSGEEDE